MNTHDRLVSILSTLKPSTDVAAALESDDDFMKVLSMDSLDAVELTTHLSTEFGVEFGEEADDLDALASLSALTALVERRRTVDAL